MTDFVFYNFINTTLSGAITSTATSMTLSSSAGLPSSIPSGLSMAFILNDVATRQNYEVVYATAISGATLTIVRAQEGTAALAWSTGDYVYSCATAGQMGSFLYADKALQVLTPSTSTTVTPTALQTIVFPSAASTQTIAAGSTNGQRVRVYGVAGAAVTVASSVSSGSPFIALPDSSAVYSWVIASAPQADTGIDLTWDGANWRAQTFGQTVVAAATALNEAVNLGQAQAGFAALNGSASQVFNVAPGTGTQAVQYNQLGALLGRGATTISGSTTLTAANAGDVIFFVGTSAATFTLPASNASAPYTIPIIISNQGTAPVTIVAPSGNGIDLQVNTLQTGQVCAVTNDGNTAWHMFWNTAGTNSPVVVGAATALNEAVQLGQALQVLSPGSSGTITPTALKTLVYPSGSSAATFTIGVGSVDGQEVTIYGTSTSAVTVSSTVSSGSPNFSAPDGTPVYSINLPAIYGSGVKLTWDNYDWRMQTFGQTIVGPAIASNQAVQLGQFTHTGSTSITLPSATAAAGTVGSSGYRKLPDGRIEQWAYIQLADPGAGSSGGTTWTFPIAFPTACTEVTGQNCSGANSQTAGSQQAAIPEIASPLPTTTAATIAVHNTSATGTLVTCLVTAKGY